ncbi:MAG: Single-stranded DNA-binding protein [Parcubacteria group bacterium GW2011_GWF2_38_76]|nr:MAG: Single-stranded DNA-binding protein [Parcubacteria group bacterium GW2011_GWF2_38_76]HBM45876.1 single-stranded DNA-binding protein [Patescibacteria group bacterium]
MYLNKAIIIGNMTKDPEMRALPSGQKVTSFSVATNRVWKDKDGKKQEGTEFHNISVFGKQAETCAQYLKKGQAVLVEGRIQTRSWDATDGTKKYRTEIIAEKVQFGPKAGGATGGNVYPSKNSVPAESGAGSQQIDYPEEEINPDDIPF